MIGILTAEELTEAHKHRLPSTSHNKSNSGIAYIPSCVYVRDLHEQASKKCLATGSTAEDMPCLTTLYAHFVVCNETNAASARYFGTLKTKRGLTASTGQNGGPDSHYNAKL